MLKLKIVSPERIEFDGEVESVLVPGSQGQFEILHDHAPIISTLAKGVVEYGLPKGQKVQFGSVGGGGRYDGLVSRFRGEPVPATGFSIGVSRLQAALTLLGKLDTGKEFGPVVVTVFDRDRVADYQKMVAGLRSAGIRAELYLGNPKNMGNQLKYADRRNSPCVIIQGPDEKAKGKVQIKDLILGAGLTEIKDREEYLKRQAEAQVEADEYQLVEAVRKILARHDVRWG